MQIQISVGYQQPGQSPVPAAAPNLWTPAVIQNSEHFSHKLSVRVMTAAGSHVINMLCNKSSKKEFLAPTGALEEGILCRACIRVCVHASVCDIPQNNSETEF